MTRPHHAWRDWTALAAAYLLVLQVLFTGMATGVQAAPGGALDLAGVICSGTLSTSDLPADGGSPHSEGSTCCVLGCPMFSPGAPLPAETWTPSHVSLTPGKARDIPPPAPVRPSAHGPSPSLARAPPSAA